MTLSDPNPGFKVTGYLKVEYLDLEYLGARVFNCTKHSCISPGALPKTCKKLVVVVEHFAQEGWKFSCLRYGGGWIACSVRLVANTLARRH